MHTTMNLKMMVFASLVSFALAPHAFAADADLSVTGATFVGAFGDCGAQYPAGSNIVTARWAKGIGLPDDGTSPSNPGNTDPHHGLLLSKNGLTTDCSAAEAKIRGVKGIALTEIGFDINSGTHCGAGAPRFDVQTDDGVFHFLGGCANATKTPAPQDPTAWTRVRIDPTNAGQAFPPIAANAKIVSISIIFDEGTDSGPGAGLAVIDNIDINGQLVTAGGQQE